VFKIIIDIRVIILIGIAMLLTLITKINKDIIKGLEIINNKNLNTIEIITIFKINKDNNNNKFTIITYL